MRLAIAIIFMLFTQVAYIGKIAPFSELDEQWQMLITLIFGLWAFTEAFCIAKRSASSVKQPDIKLKQSSSEVATEALASKNASISLLENERDELRSRNNQLTLQQKELDETVAILKSKLKELGHSRLESLDEQVVAQQAVLSFLGTLQDKGRLIDFLMDDITPYSDQQVGAAARVIHQGCNTVLKQQLSVTPIYKGEEGGQATLEIGYSPNEWRLVGAVKGQPPFKGSVLHRGWKVERLDLSKPTMDTEPLRVIAPAELEIS